MMDKAALRSYLESGKVPDAPETVHIDVTNRCDMGCITCWNHSPLSGGAKNESAGIPDMEYDFFESIAGQCAAMGVKKILISGGGEPFMHRDIYRMIELAKKSRLRVTVLTNGHYADPAPLFTAAPDKLLVNMGAATEKTFARFYRGLPNRDFGAFAEKLKTLGARIRLGLAVVVSGENWEELPVFCELAGTIPGSSLSFKKAKLTEGTMSLGIGDGERAEITDAVIPRCLDICARNGTPHNLPMFARQISGESCPVTELGCFAGALYSRVYLDGSVFFCCDHVKMGNVREARLADIWNNAAYSQTRERLRRGNYFPGCSSCGKYNLNYDAREFLDV